MTSRNILRSLLAMAVATLACGATHAEEQRNFQRLYGDLTAPIAQALEAKGIDIFEYYPLGVGSSWSYVDKAAGDMAFTLQVTDHTTYKGAPVARIRRLDRPTEYDFMSRQGSLKLWLRSDPNNGMMDWSSDPVPFSTSQTVNLGDKFEATPTSFVNPVTGGNFHWYVQIKQFQQVVVPAGTFPNCLRVAIRSVDTKSGLEVSNFTAFLAKGVGVVRKEGRFVATTFKHLLTSFQIR